MLSAETAAGPAPETAREMAKICEEAEKAEYKGTERRLFGQDLCVSTSRLAISALFTAHHPKQGDCIMTDSGSDRAVDEPP
jgi:pyruvate kinase